MKTIKSDKNLVAMCGLYCGACSKYLKNKCSGCKANEKASWCAVRTCCLDGRMASCAECTAFDSPLECKKYNNFIARFFGFIFRTDRSAGIQRIRKAGYQVFADEMAAAGTVGIKK